MEDLLQAITDRYIEAGGDYDVDAGLSWNSNECPRLLIWFNTEDGSKSRWFRVYSSTVYTTNGVSKDYIWRWESETKEVYSFVEGTRPVHLQTVYDHLDKLNGIYNVLREYVNERVIPRLYRPITGPMYLKLLRNQLLSSSNSDPGNGSPCDNCIQP